MHFRLGQIAAIPDDGRVGGGKPLKDLDGAPERLLRVLISAEIHVELAKLDDDRSQAAPVRLVYWPIAEQFLEELASFREGDPSRVLAPALAQDGAADDEQVR